MTENQETPKPDELLQEDILLQSSYVLVYLKNQLQEVRNKKQIRTFSLHTLVDILNPGFQEKNLDVRFSFGNSDFVAEKHEYHDYLEIGFTKFPNSESSSVVSEGIRIRIKRGNSPVNNFIEYHRKSLDDKNSEKLKNKKLSVSKAIEFISSIN